METETPVDDGYTATAPGFGADASSEPDVKPVEAEAEAEETEVVEESEAESPPAVEEDDDKKTDAFQGRIDKLTQSFRESERDAAALRERNESLQQKLDAVPVPDEPTKTLADFDHDEDAYRSYVFSEMTTRAEKAAERVVRGFQENQQAQSAEQSFAKAEKVFSESVSDYKETVYADDLMITQGMKAELQAIDIGPEIAYYLGKNPDEAMVISKQSPREITRSLMLLETSIRAEKKKTSKTVSDAPPPPGKIKGKNPGIKPAPNVPSSDKLSDAEWFKAEDKRMAKMRG